MTPAIVYRLAVESEHVQSCSVQTVDYTNVLDVLKCKIVRFLSFFCLIDSFVLACVLE